MSSAILEAAASCGYATEHRRGEHIAIDLRRGRDDIRLIWESMKAGVESGWIKYEWSDVLDFVASTLDVPRRRLAGQAAEVCAGCGEAAVSLLGLDEGPDGTQYEHHECSHCGLGVHRAHS